MVAYRVSDGELNNLFRTYEVSDTIRGAWDKVVKRLAKRKIQVTMCKKLGGGTQGEAWQINPTTVVKISFDIQYPPHAASVVKKYPSVYISRIHDVFGMHVGDRTIYFIVQEKLQECNETWGDFFSWISGSPLTEYTALSLIDRCVGNRKKAPAKDHIMHKWLLGAAKYFDRHQITYKDCHDGNLMRKGKQHKIIDLEYGIVAQRCKVPFPMI